MSTDRELLENAAKAAGMSGMWFANTAPDSPMFFHQPGKSVYGVWNPLTDDGDALRLAVKLKITPHIDGNLTDCEDCTEAHLGDPYAATRRAIVRAAAEIGRSMP